MAGREHAADCGKAKALLNQALKAVSGGSGTDARRWVHNLHGHKTRVLLAMGNIPGAIKAQQVVAETWRSMTIETGWDRGTRTMLLALQGIVQTHAARTAADAEEALRVLSRAAVGLLGARRMRPEGIRDVLFSAALAMERCRNKHDARVLRRIASQIADGSSWLLPYRLTDSQPT